MECPRGSSCTESTHEVKTMVKAQEWCAVASQGDLPLQIEQMKSQDGRLMVKIYNCNGKLIESRG